MTVEAETMTVETEVVPEVVTVSSVRYSVFTPIHYEYVR